MQETNNINNSVYNKRYNNCQIEAIILNASTHDSTRGPG